MARFTRVVVVDVPHHVTQRGNAQQVILSDDADRVAYVELLRQYSSAWGERLDASSTLPSSAGSPSASSGQAFDCAVTALRFVTAPLRMTILFRRRREAESYMLSPEHSGKQQVSRIAVALLRLPRNDRNLRSICAEFGRLEFGRR
jgi:hypothetical protein